MKIVPFGALSVSFCVAWAVEAYDYEPQPGKAALMVVFAHADDEGIFFGGAIAYYVRCRQLPVVAICMTHSGADHRSEELRCACWNYGMRNEPLFAALGDCCYGQDLQCCWNCWGGKDRAVAYLTEQIRKYRPDVVLCHDFDGEYGHPNHMGAGIAAAEASIAAGDDSKFREQVDMHDTWKVKKCYVHLYEQNTLWHDWELGCPETDGRTARELTNEALTCHVSQGPRYVTYGGDQDSRKWGLYHFAVGSDVTALNDFFENIVPDGAVPVRGNRVSSRRLSRKTADTYRVVSPDGRVVSQLSGHATADSRLPTGVYLLVPSAGGSPCTPLVVAR